MQLRLRPTEVSVPIAADLFINRLPGHPLYINLRARHMHETLLAKREFLDWCRDYGVRFSCPGDWRLLEAGVIDLVFDKRAHAAIFKLSHWYFSPCRSDDHAL